MPGPKAESVELTEKQRHLLQQVIRREKNMQQSVRRARIILLANSGVTNDSKATGCALEPSATKDRGCAANHGSHNPSDYRGWSENTFKSYDTNP